MLIRGAVFDRPVLYRNVDNQNNNSIGTIIVRKCQGHKNEGSAGLCISNAAHSWACRCQYKRDSADAARNGTGFPSAVCFSVNQPIKGTRRRGHKGIICRGVSTRYAEWTFCAYIRADAGCNSYADHQKDSETSERSAIPADSVHINRNSRGVFNIKGEVN